MTTVAFVSYKVNGIDRRVGPMTMEHAEPLAKHLTRNQGYTLDGARSQYVRLINGDW